MSVFEKYAEERLGVQTLMSDDGESGFIQYKIEGKECFVQDFFIVKHMRGTGLGFRLVRRLEEMAKANGCEVLTASINTKANGAHESLLSVISFGGKLHSSYKDVIYFAKGLGNGI